MIRKRFYLLFLIPVFTACLESPEMTTGVVNGKEKPTVTTGLMNPVVSDGNLVFQAEITSTGKSEITEKGFYWSAVSDDPGSNDNVITVSDATADVFTYELKNASGGKTYYWRAYATNLYGYDYGDVRSFKTPDIWIEKDSLNALARGKGAIFLIGSKIYITCGELETVRGVFVNETWEYNITTNRWNLDYWKIFPGDYRIDPVVFTVENFAFVGTGWKARGAAHKDFFRYNNTSGSWTEIATPDDFEARYQAVAFSLNGKGYVIGGLSADDMELNDIWQYDSGENSWVKKNDFPENLYRGISISNNNRVFAGFGETDETKRILWEYDEETDNWIEFITLPDEVEKKIYSGVIVQNKMYVIDEDNQIWPLDLSDKTWGRKTDLPSTFPKGQGVFQPMLTPINSNSIYVGLGYSIWLYEYRPLWDI